MNTPHLAGDERIPVLVAEDNALNQELIADLVEDSPFDPCIAADGAEALERFQERPFALVVMDLQMPVMNGLAATRAMREFEKAHGRSRTPIIALSGNCTAQDRAQAIAAGCDDFIAKPFDLDDFVGTLERWARLSMAR